MGVFTWKMGSRFHRNPLNFSAPAGADMNQLCSAVRRANSHCVRNVLTLIFRAVMPRGLRRSDFDGEIFQLPELLVPKTGNYGRAGPPAEDRPLPRREILEH